MDSEDRVQRDRRPRAEAERKQARKGTLGEKRTGRSFGRVISVLGILVALAGALTPSDVGPLGVAGMLLGALGLVLGARRLGTAAVALSWAEILLGVLTS